MRRLTCFICGLLLICWSGAGALAQDKDQDKDQDQNRAGEHYQKGSMSQIKDGVMMKEGKMYQVKDGQSTELTSEVTLSNGWKVNNDGTVMMGKGTEAQLKDGMAIDEHGKIMDEHGKVISRSELEHAYKSGAGSNERMQGGTARDGVMMKDGKVLQIKGGKASEVTNEVTLKNGWRVNNDGTVKMANGKTMQLKEGEILDMNGKRVRAGKGESMQGGMQRMDSTEMGKPEPR